MLGSAAAECSDSLIAVQIMGSRNNGTAGLESDVELVVVAFDTDDGQEDRLYLTLAAEEMGIPVEGTNIAGVMGVECRIPTDPEHFISWIDGAAGSTSFESLFDQGIQGDCSQNQKLAQLAVTSIIRANSVPGGALDAWKEVRRAHARAYLGNSATIRNKLAERLGAEQMPAIRAAITPELMKQRYVKYGLPKDMEAYYQQLADWAARNEGYLLRLPGWKLYRGVKAILEEF